MPLVSVIIPNFNYARFLDRRLQSVLNQSFQDFEVLYLDDASTDNSEEVLSKYRGDGRIRSICNQVNSGSPFKQWNRGVREAQGKYIWIAEADDYADERLLEKLVEKLEGNPAIGIAYCQSMCVDEDDKPIRTMQWWTNDLDAARWENDFQNAGQDECRRFLVNKNTLPNASAIVFRKEVYLKAGGADEAMKVCGDWMCWARCLLLCDVAYLAEPLNFFRMHGQSARSQSRTNGNLSAESYRVLSFIQRHSVVGALDMRRACDRIRNEWLDIVLREEFHVSWKNNFHIYRLARRVDSRLHLQLIKRVARHTRGQLRTWRRHFLPKPNEGRTR